MSGDNIVDIATIIGTVCIFAIFAFMIYSANKYHDISDNKYNNYDKYDNDNTRYYSWNITTTKPVANHTISKEARKPLKKNKKSKY